MKDQRPLGSNDVFIQFTFSVAHSIYCITTSTYILRINKSFLQNSEHLICKQKEQFSYILMFSFSNKIKHIIHIIIELNIRVISDDNKAFTYCTWNSCIIHKLENVGCLSQRNLQLDHLSTLKLNHYNADPIEVIYQYQGFHSSGAAFYGRILRNQDSNLEIISNKRRQICFISCTCYSSYRSGSIGGNSYSLIF